MTRDELVKIAADAIADDYGWDHPDDRENAEESAGIAIDALLAAGAFDHVLTT